MSTEKNLQLIIIRGLPGSGKSTRARSVAAAMGFRHIETDMFFVDSTGKHWFDHTKLSKAHAWCQSETRKTLAEGTSVVVSNTFVTEAEIRPYREIAHATHASLTIWETTGAWHSVHNVPHKTITRMRARWEFVL